ncbi:MarR family transcriptional regulator [Mesotoga sp. Brook.08.YT.4.2.5.1]|uniref:MarR family winged helix-turn-helix transcriptional regulator n=1 Tax=unclassified Mesotoga TaxID=1184398 RepID=UPI000C9CF9D2|nr:MULTISPECIES: MarR family transcriptional regulator [unclassified Mesotoga]PNQ05193.1 MarR family transcriptional regulator [Mesotoga sp. SC_NapDC3]PXF34199.1 MarR family transcriptional regulator [Mesotoga sp. SC_NapDC]RIZ61079.1 MarR family transcriptional regulator [Mesotoga sp. SC_NapDC2]PNE22390.1 MarR family transcriptional regulator [Mesotoga sp. Brook.08.YT.4.2.5.1]RAO96400.1 MarR family transcriptional regulator [Mesotoga sp. Brook.08.YT.4.2.5.4.]
MSGNEIEKEDAAVLEKNLRTISTRIRREGRKVLRDFPITPAQFDVLQVLFFNGEKRMSDISRWLGITKSTTTGLVKRLIDADLVERRRSDKDRRSFIIDISDSGRTLIENVIDRRVEYLKSVMTEIKSDQVKALEVIVKNLLEIMDSKKANE